MLKRVRRATQNHILFNMFVVLISFTKYCYIRVTNFLANTFVSLFITVATELSRALIDRANDLKKATVKQEQLIIDPFIQRYIIPITTKYPTETLYLNQYVLPSFQFTAIFQAGGNILGLFHGNMHDRKKVIIRGCLKAFASATVNIASKLKKGDDLKMHDLLVPLSKEPAVSVCKLSFVFVVANNDYSAKFACNFIGETSHNLAKSCFGTQKLSVWEIIMSIPVKSFWKTLHQQAEGSMVKGFGNPFGFYLASSVARSYGNKFIEDISVDGMKIDLNDFSVSVGQIVYVGSIGSFWGIANHLNEADHNNV